MQDSYVSNDLPPAQTSKLTGTEVSPAIMTRRSAAAQRLYPLFYRCGLILLAAAVLLVLVLRVQIGNSPSQHFKYLARAFLEGTFAVDVLHDYVQDKVVFNGHTYVPMGPMPGILLMPVIAARRIFFGWTVASFQEYFACLGFTVLNIGLLKRVLEQLGITEARRRRWLLALFFFGTIYFSTLIIGVSWFLAHLVTTTFLLLAISEALGARRYWLIGLVIGAAFLTRVTAICGMPFFLYLMWRERRLTLSNLAQFALGLLPLFAFYAIYNHARFGSFTETGYSHANLGGSILGEARAHGLFSLVHIPKNLYMLLLATPQPVGGFDAPVFKFPYLLPSAWGMGIFFTTPAFLYAFRANWRDARVAAAWLAVVAILLPLLTYYGVGWVQFGYRYALDFYPFLFIPTALAFNASAGSANTTLTHGQRALILVCLLINLWGAWTTLFFNFIF
jgi:hypothetical protein